MPNKIPTTNVTHQRTNTMDEVKAVTDKAWDVFEQYGDVNGVGIMQFYDGFALAIRFESIPHTQPVPGEIDGVVVGEVTVIGVIRPAGKE